MKISTGNPRKEISYDDTWDTSSFLHDHLSEVGFKKVNNVNNDAYDMFMKLKLLELKQELSPNVQDLRDNGVITEAFSGLQSYGNKNVYKAFIDFMDKLVTSRYTKTYLSFMALLKTLSVQPVLTNFNSVIVRLFLRMNINPTDNESILSLFDNKLEYFAVDQSLRYILTQILSLNDVSFYKSFMTFMYSIVATQSDDVYKSFYEQLKIIIENDDLNPIINLNNQVTQKTTKSETTEPSTEATALPLIPYKYKQAEDVNAMLQSLAEFFSQITNEILGISAANSKPTGTSSNTTASNSTTNTTTTTEGPDPTTAFANDYDKIIASIEAFTASIIASLTSTNSTFRFSAIIPIISIPNQIEIIQEEKPFHENL